jgi:membrane-associated protease RseP (regulator of RpoE activity)
MKFLVKLSFTALLITSAFGQSGRLGLMLSEEQDNGKGVSVSSVLEESGSWKAGIRKDDLITAVNGQPVLTVDDVHEALKDKKAGEAVTVDIRREDAVHSFQVELSGNRVFAREGWTGKPKKWIFSGSERPWLGIQTHELTPQLATFFKAEHGVLVESVVEDTPALKAGLRAGDIITALAGEKVVRTFDIHKILNEKQEGEELALTYLRNGKEMSGQIKVENRKGDSAFHYEFFFDDGEGVEDVLIRIPDPHGEDVEIERRVKKEMMALEAHNSREHAERRRLQAELMREQAELMHEELENSTISAKDREELEREIRRSLEKELTALKAELEALRKKIEQSP